MVGGWEGADGVLGSWVLSAGEKISFLFLRPCVTSLEWMGLLILNLDPSPGGCNLHCLMAGGGWMAGR